MLTEGQVTSLSTGGGVASPTACDFEPNSSLKREPIDGLDSAEEPPNMLPPPQPDKSAPATTSVSPTPRWRARPAAIVRIISLLRIRLYPPTSSKLWRAFEGRAGWRVISVQSRQTQG